MLTHPPGPHSYLPSGKQGVGGAAVVVAAAVSLFVLTSPPSPHVHAHSPVLVPIFVWPSFTLARLCACPRLFVPAWLFAHSAFAWPLFVPVRAHSPRLFVLVLVFVWPSFALVWADPAA